MGFTKNLDFSVLAGKHSFLSIFADFSVEAAPSAEVLRSPFSQGASGGATQS